MSEVSHFFATRVAALSSLRKSLEVARVQAIVSTLDGDGVTGPDTPVAGGRWMAFAAPSQNREPLRSVTQRLLEVFDNGGADWSLSLFLGTEELTLSFPEPEPPGEAGAGLSTRQWKWLQLFFERDPSSLLPLLSFGSAHRFCQAANVPFLNLMDQDFISWDDLARRFPGQYMIQSKELVD